MEQFIIALGMFDGIHIGHRALLTTAVREAEQKHCIPSVFTYENHPKELFTGRFAYLSTIEQRKKIMESLGIQKIDLIPFTREFAALSPEAFIQYLKERYQNRIRMIVCGYDYRFGKNASGTPETMQELGTAYGFDVSVIPPVYFGRVPCSSSLVRETVRQGDMVSAMQMLSRPYAMTGQVIHNKGIGKTLGIPTANLDCKSQILPKDGVYATALHCDGNIYPAITNIGSNPTVHGDHRTVETHIPDFSGDLYDRTITISFLKRIRDEIRFASTEALTEQIQRDLVESEKIFKESKKSVYNTVHVW